jgi:hypothetical protein
VLCVHFHTGAKAYEKAEDPIYALENNLPIDVQHYLDHHLTQPLMRIFEPVCKDVKAELLSGGCWVRQAACMCCNEHDSCWVSLLSCHSRSNGGRDSQQQLLQCPGVSTCTGQH